MSQKNTRANKGRIPNERAVFSRTAISSPIKELEITVAFEEPITIFNKTGFKIGNSIHNAAKKRTARIEEMIIGLFMR